jgi:hypothetical protein
MNFCPNTSSPEWKALVDAVGEFEAMRDFMEYQTIRNVEDLRLDKLELFKDVTPSFVKTGVEEIFKSNPKLASIGTEEEYSKYLDSVFPGSQIKDIVYHGSGYTFDTFKSKDGTFIFFTKSKDYASVYAEKSFEGLLEVKPHLEKRIRKYNFLSESVYGDPANIYDAYRFYDELLPNLINIGKYSAEKIADSISNAKDVMAIHQLYIQPNFERGYLEDSGDEDIARADNYEEYLAYKNMSAEERERVKYLEDQKLASDAFRYEKTVEEVKRRLKKYLRKETKELSKEGLFSINKALKETEPQKNIYRAVLNIQNPQYADFEVSHETIKENLSQIDKSKDSLIGEEGALKARLSSGTRWITGQESISVKSPEQIHILGGQKDIEGFKNFMAGSPVNQVSFYRDQAQYSERYSVLDNPIELDEAEFQQTRGNEIAEKLANKLRASVGVNSQLITLAHAKEMMDNAGKAYMGEPGFFFNGQVYLVREKMTTEIVFHEFAHPILKAIAIDNPELFENLYLQLSSTSEGQAIIEEVKKFYPEYDEESSDFKEEALVRGLSRAADAKFKNQPQSSGFLGFIKELLYSMKQFMRKLFKGTKIKIENLSETTTLDQLADMLMSESFAISAEKVTNADVVAFARDTRQQMIDDLASMEQNELAKLSKNMFDVFNKQAKIISSKNYKEIGQTLSDTMKRSDIREILGNLRMFQREGDVKFETAEDEIKYMNAHAEAFLNSMTRFNLASRRILEHFKEISKDLNNPLNISRAFYLNRVIRDWGLFLNDIKSELRNQEYSEYIGPGNPLLGLINEIEETLTRTKSYSDKIYTAGVKDTIVDQLAPMAQTIDNYYTNILKRYEEKNAPPEVIARVKREYEEIRLTPKKIDQLLKGELGDAGAINSFLEGYMNNQDPIIFGFAGYVKDRFTAMNAVIQSQFNNFINSVSGLVDAAGYTTAYSRMQMGKDLLFLDTVRNESEGKDARKVWKFLNPWTDYEKDVRDLENKVEETKKIFNEQKTDQAEEDYNTAIKNLKDFKAQYMHQEYTEEFGKLRSFFQDEVGKKAEAARAAILNKIQGLNSTVSSVDDIVDNLESLEVYWREYRLLYSLYNADGSPKEEDSMAYKVAIRLREHRNMSNKFYKWTPRKGAFQSAYLNFRQSLIDNGIKPTGKTAKEFKEKLDEWVSKNTVIKLTDKFYEDRAEIFARMSELSTEPAQLKIVENYGKIANIISAYKDKNSEPIGSEMPAELLATIKKIEEEIEELKQEVKESTTGLTAAEYDMYRSYKESIAMGEEPSEDEIDEFRRIKGKMKKKGITEEDLSKNAELSALYDRLNALQKREVSHDFIELVNDFLTSDPESLQIMKKSLKISRFSPTDIKMLQDSAIAEKFFDVNPKFKEWFLANTIPRKTKRKGTKYYPTRAWTYIKPQDSAYYEKIEIKDDQDRTIDTIPGSPSLQYFYREVKDEYVDDNGEVIQLRTKRLTMLDAIRQGLPIENATVDMRGNFLPKLSGGNKYRNEAYFMLQNNSPAKFRLLQELIKQHLMLQEEMPYDSRLDLEAPRYRKSGLEAITSRPVADTFRQNPLAVWARKIKSFFVRSADDMEAGLNPEEQSVVIKSDLYDDSHGRVPITGMYDIEPDQVSMDVMTGMMRYMQSGVRQKTLLEMMPTARALQSIVQNPDNNPDLIKDGVKIFSKAKMAVASVITPQSQKALSIRAQAINAFIEREFEGKTQAGITKNMVGLNKTVSALFGLSSKAFFAFNIPSALKNSFGARFQSIIEGAGGKYFNWADYMKGTVWGNKVTAEISMELYKFGPKSVDVQLFEMMDPSQGRLASKISQGTGISRSVFTDTAELGFLTNVRKWTELNATAGTFGAMLKKTLIERTMPDGSVEKVSYDNAWEVVDGQIQLKSGIDKKWDKGGSAYNNFIRNLHGVINNLNGAYASFDSPNANRYLLFRFMMYMKTYFTRMFMNRFQYRYEKGMILPRYDANLNDVSMGYYVEFLNGIKNLLVRYKGNVNLMTPNEVTAMKKTVVEVGMLLLISELIVGFLFDFDPDDDDKYEKLRQKSGPFPGLFVAEDEHPFKAPGWFSNHMLNLALQVRAENDSFIPYPRWGLQDYGNLLNMESVSLQATLDMYIKLFTGITDYADYKLTGDQTALYKREVGPYYWQQEGGLKFVNHLAKTLSLSGTTVEPVVAISGLQSRENR